jgi:hypothetical protein
MIYAQKKYFDTSVQECLNILDFLNMKKSLNYFNKSLLEKYSFKIRFSISFFFAVLKLRSSFESMAFSYYIKVPLIQINEKEI